MNLRPYLPLAAALAAVGALAGAGACTSQCEFDTDCSAGNRCVDNACAAIPADELNEIRAGVCDTDAQCSEGEVCKNRRCRDELLEGNPLTCPEPPLSEELVCSNWDPEECPCYAGVVAFHEKDEGGRLSCAGVVGIFSDVLYIKQNGCHIEALDGQLTGDAVGFGELKLRIANLPNDTSCSALADRWARLGGDGRPAVRITCSATCKIWMEQFPKLPPERIVPDGNFFMGSAEGIDLPPDRPEEGPEHLVDTTCFYMDRFEVSRGEYLTCLDAGPCSPPLFPEGQDRESFFAPALQNLPVTYVTHRQAEDYCKFREKSLPTEAEWERAARASRWAMSKYPWGPDEPVIDDRCGQANVAGCSGQLEPVDNAGGGDSLRNDGASFFDIVDLAGNAREWTRDYFNPSVYARRAASAGENGAKNPEQLEPDPSLGEVRVVRGGSYLTDVRTNVEGNEARVAARTAVHQNDTAPDLGFRCVRYKPGVAR